MGDFQTDVLDKIAQVIGGAATSTPHFYSGAGGVAGISGCYSVPPPQVDKTPAGIVLLDTFKADLASEGAEDNEDQVRLLLLISPYKMEAELARLVPYRDSVPAAFRTHMQLFGAPDTLDAFVTSGRGGVHEWRGTSFLAYEFTVRIRRMLTVTYTP